MLKFALVEGYDQNVGDSTDSVWLEAIPARVYHTPMYGEVPVTLDKLQRMVDGFKGNVRGQEIAINYDHGEDKAKGNKAAGWFKDFAIKPSSSDPSQMSLYAAVDFTEEARKEIKEGGWKYHSLEWEDLWMDNSGKVHPDVIVGGAVTNRPIAKNMATLPVNFSESQWDALPDEDKARITKFNEEVKAATALLTANGFIVKDESKEWEHSEPGTGPTPQVGSPEQIDPGTGQPVPRIQGDPSKEDPAIGGGWRRDPLPLDPDDPNAPKSTKRDEGGSELTPEELIELKKALGLKDDAEVTAVIESAKTMFSETATLKAAVGNASKEMQFAEQFPTQFREHQELLASNRESNARAFSESVKTVTRTEGDQQVTTGKGLSALALDTVKDVHKKFSEGTATTADFENAVRVIVGGGIVEFGESGSNQGVDLIVVDASTPGGVQNARKQFAEKVAEVQREDKIDYRAALAVASQKYPDLAAAYLTPLSA